MEASAPGAPSPMAATDGSIKPQPRRSGNSRQHSPAEIRAGASLATAVEEKQSPCRQDEAKSSTRHAEPRDGQSASARLLQFLSAASPHTLGAICVGLGAALYLVLGQLGLLLIGALSGVCCLVAWEARNPDVSRVVRGERGADVLERVLLDLASAKRGPDGTEVLLQDEEDFNARSLDDFRPETRDALAALIDAVIRDYVKWWYNPIVPSDLSFPLACRKTLTSYLLGISNHLSRKRPADVFLDLLTNSSSIIIVFMSELATAFARQPADSGMTAVDAVYDYLACEPDSRLASMLSQRHQHAKFKVVAEDMLNFLDRNSYNCDPARVFLREILANSVLETTLQTCSQAEWINGWIVYLLEAGEPDLSQAIDVGMQTGRDIAPNPFADMDGNVGNIGIAKPVRSQAADEGSRSRRKESSSHRKKLSKADEELEEAMEEVKRMNAMISKDDGQGRDSPVTASPAAEGRGQAHGSVTAPPAAPSPHQPLPSLPQQAGGSGDAPAAVNGRRSGSIPHAPSTDGAASSWSEAGGNPATPRSTVGSSSQASSPRPSEQSSRTQFTSFDQIVPPGQEEASDAEAPKKAPLTLHNASFTLHDDASGDRGKMRSKPAADYLIQVEPAAAGHSGWMIVRRYSDFETLHEILSRIAKISGAVAFTEQHRELPSWKVHTRDSLRGELERYLRDACWSLALAESEGMKRFLEKSQGHTHTSSKSFGWDAVGKNMMDFVSTAPKGAMEGGQKLVGNVSGVLGSFPGLVRKSTSQSVDLTQDGKRLSISTPPRAVDSARSPARSERASIDSQRSSVISTQPGKVAPMERRPSFQSLTDGEGDVGRSGRQPERMDSSASVSASAQASREHSRAPSLAPPGPESVASLDHIKLPPTPGDITDDYEAPGNGGAAQLAAHERGRDGRAKVVAAGSTTTFATAGMVSSAQPGEAPPPSANGTKKGAAAAKRARQLHCSLTEPETRVAVELIFAVISEMYTLSSAWNIRRTLLAAAKSFLLRPGNPSLVTVQSLMQSSVLDANTSDGGVALQLRKLRENTMPTDEERAAWPAELTAEEKEQLAARARKMLIQRGVPAALMGVMGQVATGEALGRVFDCLQIEEVARGLLFGLMLQAVKVVTH